MKLLLSGLEMPEFVLLIDALWGVARITFSLDLHALSL